MMPRGHSGGTKTCKKPPVLASKGEKKGVRNVCTLLFPDPLLSMKVRKSKIHSVLCCPKDDGRNPAPGDESRTCVHAVCSTFRRVMHYLLASV